MKFLSIAAAVALTTVAAGCVIVDADVDDHNMRYSSGAERVYAADISDDAITLRVAASGCTSKDFFEVDIDHRGDSDFAVEFDRTRRDYCEMFQPDGETLTWTFSELGIPAGATIILENPVGR